MAKRKQRSERRLIVVSKRRQPTDEGLARLVAAMVLHRVSEQRAATPDDSTGAPAGATGPEDAA